MCAIAEKGERNCLLAFLVMRMVMAFAVYSAIALCYRVIVALHLNLTSLSSLVYLIS